MRHIPCTRHKIFMDKLYSLVQSQHSTVSFLSLRSYFRGCLRPTSKGRFPDSFFIWKPKIVAVSWYGMFIISMDLSHVPKAIALDFCMFTLAPDAASKQCIAPCMSVGVVTNIVTSSAYAATKVLSRCRPIRRSWREFSRVQRSGFKHIYFYWRCRVVVDIPYAFPGTFTEAVLTQYLEQVFVGKFVKCTLEVNR